jgi:hypothetical protein
MASGFLRDLLGRFRGGEPAPEQRPDPEGRFYRLDELGLEGQHDPDVQRAYAAEIIGFTLYRDDQLDLLPVRRTVKAVFDDYEYTFAKIEGGEARSIVKADLPLPLLCLALSDGYAQESDLRVAETRVAAERRETPLALPALVDALPPLAPEPLSPRPEL